MQIKNSNSGSRGMTLAGFDKLRVVFGRGGIATVPDEIGRYLISTYASITDVTKPSKQAKNTESSATDKVVKGLQKAGD